MNMEIFNKHITQNFLANFKPLEESLADLNSGKEPTISTAGLHAPFDGYVGLNYETYRAGQFIPQYEDSRKASSKARIKMPLAIIKELNNIETTELSSLEAGKSWEENDLIVCYAYVTGTSEAVKLLVNGALKAFQELNETTNILAPEGRQEVQGVIENIKIESSIYHNGYGYSRGNDRCVMRVLLDNGSTVQGTAPKALHNAEGSRVQFTATFERNSYGDRAYFKRPSKASVLGG